MPTGKLVSDLGNTNRANLNLSKLVTFLVNGDHYLIHNPCLTWTQECARVFLAKPPSCSFQLIIIFWQSDGLSYNDIITTNSSTRRYEAIIVKFIISCIPHTLTCLSSWFFKCFFL